MRKPSRLAFVVILACGGCVVSEAPATTGYEITAVRDGSMSFVFCVSNGEMWIARQVEGNADICYLSDAPSQQLGSIARK